MFHLTMKNISLKIKACGETNFTIIIHLLSLFVKSFLIKGGIFTQRTVLHCDINNCFASIEALLEPRLRGLPIAVCGSKEERHGIVLAKSEEAKKFGVRTAEPIWQAQRKCPQLVIVSPHYSEYGKYSKAIRQLHSEYTDLVEPFGMDECWLDVTQSRTLFGNGVKIANEIRERIKREIGLTVSVGVSFNKVFAKLGSDLKKPDAVTVIGENFRQQIWKLKASEMLGVGPSAEARLSRYCIHTIGDIASTSPDFLERKFGKWGLTIWKYANGLDNSPVMPIGYVSPIKSIGHGETPCRDMENNDQVWLMLFYLTQDISKRLRENSLLAKGVSVRVKDNLLATVQFQGGVKFPTSCAYELASEAFRLFREKYTWQNPVRALSVTAINLCSDSSYIQLDLEGSFERHRRSESIERAADSIRSQFGKYAITPAALLHRKKGEYIPPAFCSLPHDT